MCVTQALKMRRQDDCPEFSPRRIILWDLVSETGKRRKERGARKGERRKRKGGKGKESLIARMFISEWSPLWP